MSYWYMALPHWMPAMQPFSTEYFPRRIDIVETVDVRQDMCLCFYACCVYALFGPLTREWDGFHLQVRASDSKPRCLICAILTMGSTHHWTVDMHPDVEEILFTEVQIREKIEEMGRQGPVYMSCFFVECDIQALRFDVQAASSRLRR